MKKSLLISAFLVSTCITFGQFIVTYSGGISNHPSTPIMVFLEIDSVVVDSVLTNPSTAGYIGQVSVPTAPWIIRVFFYDCNGIQVTDNNFPASTITSPYAVSFASLNYCTTTPPCNASFTKFQAVDSSTNLPIPNEVILVDGSTGSGLVYMWDFGDGSAPVAGLNVTHTYATHGSYNVCLTVTSSTAGIVCTSTFCDTLTVDSTGTIRAAFTVRTGNASLSIKDKSTITSLNLYPNPANQFASIEFEAANPSNVLIKIVDMKGSEIRTVNQAINAGNNKINLTVSDLNEGMYLIQILDGTSMVTKRLQIVK